MKAPVKLYGVLDCARSPVLYEHAARLEPEAADCLFAGKLEQGLRQVCPFVVELAPSDPLSRLWRTTGWGQAWGILVSSSASLPVVRRRLRHFTMAKLPDGSGPVMFRFWDPRVLRTYMPLIEPDAVGEWFKDIDRYTLETADGSGSIRYTLNEGSLIASKGPRPAA